MNELPELPTTPMMVPQEVPAEGNYRMWKPSPLFTADQMRSYALSAVQMERERAMRAVAALGKETQSREQVEIIGRCWSAIRSPAKEG